MKNKILGRALKVCTAVLLCAAMCGCSLKVGTKKEPKSDKVIATCTKDGEEIEELAITYGEFSKEYKYNLLGAGIEDDTEESVESTCRILRNSIINYIINEKLINYKAKENGVYDLSDEELDEAEKNYNATVENLVKSFGEMAQSELRAESGSESLELTSDEITEKGNERLDEILEKSGMTRDDLHRWEVNSIIYKKMQELLGQEVEYSDAEKAFKQIQEGAEEQYKNDPATFVNSGGTSYWLPEGARYVKHILLAFDNDTRKQISMLRSDKRDDDANELRAEKVKTLTDKQAEVEKKLNEGAKFEDMMKEYSDEDNMDKYPDGYICLPDGGTYVEEFQRTAFELKKPGDIKACVSDFGIHIMLYVKDAEISDETVKQYTEYVYASLKSSKISEYLGKWKEEYIYEIDYDTLRIDEPEETSDASEASEASEAPESE